MLYSPCAFSEFSSYFIDPPLQCRAVATNNNYAMETDWYFLGHRIVDSAKTVVENLSLIPMLGPQPLVYSVLRC